MKKPKTMEDYLKLVDDALFEVGDLRESLAFDEEAQDDAYRFVDALEPPLRALHQQINAGDYAFGDQDLAFMPVIARVPAHFLPFKGLLELINETHRTGLET